MATLYRNWTVAVQDSQSPYSPVSDLELHLFEGKVEIKTDPATGLKKVFVYGTSDLATYVEDRNGVEAVALVSDAINRPGEYDFLELNLNKTGSASAEGLTLYSVVGKPALAADFSNGRVIIDSTSLDDPNTKQVLANLGGGLGTVVDNIFYAGGTVDHSLYSSSGTPNSATIIHIKLNNLPDIFDDLTEVISEAPPYYDTSLPSYSTVLIPRFNVTYTNESNIVARWKAVRAYVMSGGEIVLRLRADQYSIYRTVEFGTGLLLDLTSIESSLKVSVDVEDQNTHYRSFNKDPQHTIPTSGPEGVVFTAYQSNGLENAGIGQWGFSNPTTDMPITGIDMKHSRGMRFGTPTYPNSLVVDTSGRLGINTAIPQAAIHAPAINSSGIPIPAMAVGKLASATGGSAIALGNTAAASAANAFALGHWSVASGADSIALGESATASASYAIAIGQNSNSSAARAIAMGTGMNVSGANSMGISLDLTGYTVSQANVLAVLGGRVAIGTTEAISGGILTLAASSTIGPRIRIRNTYSASTPSNTVLGGIDFSSYDGTVTNAAAEILAYAESVWTSPDGPAYLSFNVRPTTSALAIPRMRLTSDGVLQVGRGQNLTGNRIEIITVVSPANDNLNLSFTTGLGTTYVGQFCLGSVYGAYLGATQGLSANNLNVFTDGKVGIGTTIVTGSSDKLHVVSSTANVSIFKASLVNTATLTLWSRLVAGDSFAYINAYNDASGWSNASFGVFSGYNDANLNIRQISGSVAYIGIGTTFPMRALDIVGSVSIGYPGVSTTTAGLVISGSLGIGTTNASTALTVYKDANLLGRFYRDSNSSAAISIQNNEGVFYVSTDGNLLGLGTNISPSASGLVVDSLGNIGIGITTGISAKVHILGNLIVTGALQVGSLLIDTSDLTDNTYKYLTYTQHNSNNYGLLFTRKTSTTGELSIWTNSSQALVVDNSGNVGVGLAWGSSVYSKFHVEGNSYFNGQLGIGTTSFGFGYVKLSVHVSSGLCRSSVSSGSTYLDLDTDDTTTPNATINSTAFLNLKGSSVCVNSGLVVDSVYNHTNISANTTLDVRGTVSFASHYFPNSTSTPQSWPAETTGVTWNVPTATGPVPFVSLSLPTIKDGMLLFINNIGSSGILRVTSVSAIINLSSVGSTTVFALTGLSGVILQGINVSGTLYWSFVAKYGSVTHVS